jgi:hypothetical protein
MSPATVLLSSSVARRLRVAACATAIANNNWDGQAFTGARGRRSKDAPFIVRFAIQL